MERLKRPDKTKLTVILLAAVGIVLIVFGGLAGTKTAVDAESYTEVGFYTAYLEERIANLCVSVSGVEQAAVFLTLDCSSEFIYGTDGASDFLILSGTGGDEAVLLQEIYPKVRGVAVVCTGGDLPRVRETVTELLSAALDLPTHKIRVAGG